MIKITGPTRDNLIEDRFGRCENDAVFTIDAQRRVTGAETLDSPQGCGCRSNIAGVLQARSVKVMQAGRNP